MVFTNVENIFAMNIQQSRIELDVDSLCDESRFVRATLVTYSGSMISSSDTIEMSGPACDPPGWCWRQRLQDPLQCGIHDIVIHLRLWNEAPFNAFLPNQDIVLSTTVINVDVAVSCRLDRLV